jgi:hypothetical protein
MLVLLAFKMLYLIWNLEDLNMAASFGWIVVFGKIQFGRAQSGDYR